jgi:hypothetical protein
MKVRNRLLVAGALAAISGCSSESHVGTAGVNSPASNIAKEKTTQNTTNQDSPQEVKGQEILPAFRINSSQKRPRQPIEKKVGNISKPAIPVLGLKNFESEYLDSEILPGDGSNDLRNPLVEARPFLEQQRLAAQRAEEQRLFAQRQ